MSYLPFLNLYLRFINDQLFFTSVVIWSYRTVPPSLPSAGAETLFARVGSQYSTCQVPVPIPVLKSQLSTTSTGRAYLKTVLKYSSSTSAGTQFYNPAQVQQHRSLASQGTLTTAVPSGTHSVTHQRATPTYIRTQCRT